MSIPTMRHRAGRLACALMLGISARFCLGAGADAATDAASPPAASCIRQAGENPLMPWRSISSGLSVPDPLSMSGVARSPARQRIRLISPIAVAARGTDVFVVDSTQSAILHFDSGMGTVSVFAPLRSVPLGVRLYLDRDLSLYLLDPVAAEVLRYERSGVLVQRIQNSEALANPVAIVADGAGSGEILVADALRPYIIGLNDLGAVTRTLGARTAAPLPFQRIDGLAAGRDGLYVLDRPSHRVHVLSPGGDYRAAFGEKDLSMPAALAADDYGRVYVADNFDATIKVFAGGKLMAAAGGPGGAPGRFQQIFDLWVDGELLYVADTLGARIEIMHIAPPCP